MLALNENCTNIDKASRYVVIFVIFLLLSLTFMEQMVKSLGRGSRKKPQLHALLVVVPENVSS